MVTAGTAFDKDYDGFDDLLYVGDLTGKIWRVNLKTNPWTVSLLFNNTQPIQAAPILTVNEQGRVMLFFGTGKYLSTNDLGTTATQTLYGIVDDASGTTLTRASLVNQTSTINAVTATSKGWYIDLSQASGERIVRNAALVAGTLYVPSLRPKSGVCESGGESWLYAVDYADGSAPDNSNGTENNTTTGRVNSKGDGILSNPSIDLVNEDIILQSSTTTMISQDIDIDLQRLIVRSWRQRWN
jgi:type IV pilus assembly protein PilY1